MKKYIWILLMGICLTGQAQELLDTAVVTASRIPLKPFETGKSIAMISAKEIKELPVHSVDELLNYVAGMNMNSRAAFGVQSDIGIRGSTFSQVVILVDNQRLNDPLTGHFNNNIPVPLNEIHHIEIVRGSGSVAYGSDAVGGIINVVTKTYWHSQNTQDQSYTTGQIGFGAYNLTLNDATAYWSKSGFGLSASLKSSASDGPTYENPNYANQQLGDSLYRAYFNLKTYTVAAHYSGEQFSAYARVGADQRDFSAKYFYTASPYDESTEQVEHIWAQTALTLHQDRSKTRLQMGWKSNSDYFEFNPLFAANEHSTNRLNATLFQERSAKNIQLAYGLQSDAQIITSTDRGDHELATHAAFATAQKTMGPLSINGGFRMEYNEFIGWQAIPQANFSYIKNGIVLRASAGRSIRQADFTERFVSFNLTNLSPGRNAGNPDLVAESAWSGDLGFEKIFSSNWRLSNTVFLRLSTNLIDFISTQAEDITNLSNLQDSGQYFYATNVGESKTWGNEFSLAYRKQMNDFQFHSILNYTYLSTSIAENLASKYLANHPRHNISVLARGTYKGISLQFTARAVQRNAEVVPSISGEIQSFYALLNSRISYQMGAARIYLDVRNALNIEYQEIMGARMPGRWLVAGLSWEI